MLIPLTDQNNIYSAQMLQLIADRNARNVRDWQFDLDHPDQEPEPITTHRGTIVFKRLFRRRPGRLADAGLITATTANSSTRRPLHRPADDRDPSMATDPGTFGPVASDVPDTIDRPRRPPAMPSPTATAPAIRTPFPAALVFASGPGGPDGSGGPSAATVVSPRAATTEATGERRVTAAHVGMLVFLGAVWGAAFLSLRIAAPEVGPVWTAWIRIAIGAALLLFVAGRRTWPIARANPRPFVIVGAAFSAVPFTLISFAALTLPIGVGAVLNSTTPLFTAILVAAWLGERPTSRTVAGLVVGVAAVVVLVGWTPLEFGPAMVLAVAAMLGGAFAYAVGSAYVKRALPGIPGLTIATGQLTAGALLLLPLAILSGPPGIPSPTAIVALITVGILSTAIPWPIYLHLIHVTTPTVASTVTFIVPAFAMVWGSIVLGEPIGPELLAGFGLIVVSLVLVLRLSAPSHVPARVRAASASRAAAAPAAA